MLFKENGINTKDTFLLYSQITSISDNTKHPIFIIPGIVIGAAMSSLGVFLYANSSSNEALSAFLVLYGGVAMGVGIYHLASPREHFFRNYELILK